MSKSNETARRPLSAEQVLFPVTLFILFLVAWDLLLRLGMVSDYILPTPIGVAQSMWDLGQTSLLWTSAAITFYETIAGFVIGSGLAFILAVFSALSPRFRLAVYPYMVALQVTPRIAITPILIAWLGFGVESKIVLAATICFFPVFINTLAGMTATDEDSMEMFRSIRASRWQVFRQLMLPTAMPVVFAGLKTAMTLALIGAIVGEFVSAQEGMGLLIQQFSFQLNMEAAFAVLLYLTLLGLVLHLLMEAADKHLVFWMHDARLSAKTRSRQRRAESPKPAAVREPLDPIHLYQKKDVP